MNVQPTLQRCLLGFFIGIVAWLAPETRSETPVLRPVVGITATGVRTSEPLPTAFIPPDGFFASLIAPGVFTVWRKDAVESQVTVFLSYGGTASSDDYETLPTEIVIPTGRDQVEIRVLSKSDDLIEGIETVVAKILMPPTRPDTIPYEIASESAEIKIHDEDQAAGLPVVRIKTVREEDNRAFPLTRVAPAELVAYLDRPAAEELAVYLAVEGSATPSIDYDALEKFVRFPAGSTEARILIGAFDDNEVEGDETVAVALIDPPTDGLPTYTIDLTASAAKVLIRDNDSRELGAVIKISHPDYGAELPAGVDVEVNAVAVDPEGYIPTIEFYVDGQLLDRSVITFVRAPDPGTPVYHSVLWKSPAPGKHELIARGKDSHGVVSSEAVIVIVGRLSEDTLVSIKATDPEGTELPISFSSIDPVEFELSRTGPSTGALTVFFSLHGTASKDDYFEAPASVIIPAGSASARLQIVPKADLLKILEPMETVGVRLEPSPVAGPLRTYGIDPNNSSAGGVIYEQRPPEVAAVELVFPVRGEGFEVGQPIPILAASYAAEGTLAVDFYDGEKKIGQGLMTVDASDAKAPTLAFPSFTWWRSAVGEHILTARATLADGKQISSQPCLVVVKGSDVTPAYIKIAEPGDGQEFKAGASIQITAVAVDPEGYIPRVEFFANDRQIGVSEIAFFRAPDPGTPIQHSFLWENVPAGTYVITVRSVDSHGRAVTSFPVKIVVGEGGGGGGSNATIEIVAPKTGEVFEAGSDIPVTAIAIDPRGYISRVEFFANERSIGVSEIFFIRAPDPGEVIRHSVLWPRTPAGEYALTARGIDSQGQAVTSQPVKIVVTSDGGGGTGDQVVVMVEAIDQYAAELGADGAPDKGVFLIRRIGGPQDIEVPVMFKLSGAAVNGVDYDELKEMVMLRAGAESAEVVITPIPDKAIEPDETVELTLVPPICPAIFPPPPQCYLIAKSGAARVLIRDQSRADDVVQPKVAIALPPSEGTGKPEFDKPLAIRADATVQGKPCVLETSIDLKTWAPVAPVFLPDGQLTYVTETGTENQRYYRLRVQ